MGLKADEKITLREVVYGLMLASGNDAANTIADYVGGSIENFVKMMNERAAKIGLENTHFCNPSGLYNEKHYTSAHDLALLAAVAMKNENFAKVVGTKSIRVSYDGIKNGRYLSNHNRLLGAYEGSMGVKTGFTKKSGRCLVSCAKRNGVELIAATLNDPDDWRDHEDLLNRGFKTLESSQLLNSVSQIKANVVGGTSDVVETKFDKTATAALKTGEFNRVEQHCELDRFFYAPIKKGQVLGKIVYTVDGTAVATTDITAACDVEIKENAPAALNFFEQLWKNITDFFQKLFH
jgi:D-alanyl-D-alanine carboxypeptidase